MKITITAFAIIFAVIIGFELSKIVYKEVEKYDYGKEDSSPNSDFPKNLTPASLAEDQKQASNLWLSVTNTTKKSIKIERRTYHAKPTRILIPFSQSESDIVEMRITVEPSIRLINKYIKDNIFEEKHHKYKEMRYDLDRITDNRLRVRIFQLKSVVLTNHSYWEYLYLDLSLDPINLNSTIYDLSIVMAGKFAAGGLPSDIKDYKDMIVEGYSHELSSYAKKLVSNIKSYLEHKEEIAIFPIIDHPSY